MKDNILVPMTKLLPHAISTENVEKEPVAKLALVHEYFLTFSFALLFLGNNLFDKKMLALFLIVQVALLIAYRSIDFFKNAWRFSGLILLLAWSSYSATWSQFPSATWSGVSLLASVMLACVLSGYLSINCNWQRALRNAIVIALAINLFYIVVFYSAAMSPHGLRSFYPTKNSLGLVSALSVCILLFTPNKKIIDYVFIGLGCLLLLLSQSKTSLSLAIIIVLLIVFKNVLLGRGQIKYVDDAYLIFISVLWLGFFCVVLALFAYQKDILDYIFLNLSDEMFTGRGKLWLEMLRLTEYKLAFGLGFNAVWGMEDLNQIYLTQIALDAPIWAGNLVASDGGYVDIVVSLGVVGLVIFLFALVQIFCDIAYSKSINVLLVLFVFPILHNITETTFLMGVNIIWIILLFSAGVAAAEKKFVKKKHE